MMALLPFAAPLHAGSGDYPELYGQLTEGVQEIPMNGARPGIVQLLGRETFPLVQDEQGDVWAAVGFAGEGRVFVAGHTLFLEPRREGGAHRLVSNVLGWIQDGGEPGRAALIGGYRQARGILEEQGWQIVGPDQDADVILILGAPLIDPYQRRALVERVRAGAGLLVVGTPWAYEEAARESVNGLLDEIGFRWSADVIGGHREIARIPEQAPDPIANPHVALARLNEWLSQEDEDREDSAWSTMAQAVSQLPLDDLRMAVDQLGGCLGEVIPTRRSPLVRGQHSAERAFALMQQALLEQLPVDQATAHPAAAEFPGAVPEDAERLDTRVTIDGNSPHWDPGRTPSNPRAPQIRGTGLYAAPGEVIRVTVPEQAVGQGLRVRIGMYGRDVTRADQWQRWPSQLREFNIDSPVVEAVNPFGGLINIEVPQGTELGKLEITIEGAVAAPTFVLGRDDPEDWSRLREARAPWGQVESRQLILTVPSRVLREVEDLVAVLEFWDTVMDASADLAAIPRDRPRKEWIATDRQLVAGYMHSGYPIGVNTAQAPVLFELDRMSRSGSWGLFHELGHNHQHIDWLLPGTIESSVNLWSVYVHEEVLGIPRSEAHGALAEGEPGRRWQAYVESGKARDQWQVWLALDYYLQIQQAFGWQAYKDVFAAYQQLGEDERPRNDAEKFDLWLVKLSQAVGRDLTAFHEAWNLPFSESARQAVADLDPWLDHPAVDPS